ncbi:hypothetical protein AURDEDRAFT_185368 [Auricularia subglabra TFB-10046 SS5]|nr:hypothetical protein AURDEDRAFT_185368 [Auricularia subglabra TFB-10046 SS5]
MYTLATLPEDVLGAILRFLNARTLVALSQASKYFYAATSAKFVWITALRTLYLSQGVQPIQPDQLVALTTRELRKLALRPIRALSNMGRRAPVATAVRQAPPEEPMEGLVGAIISFFVVPGGEYALVAENDVDWGSITFWQLPAHGKSGASRIVTRRDFDRPLCCVDVQLSGNGRALEIVLSEEQGGGRLSTTYAHLILRIPIPTGPDDPCEFQQVADFRSDKFPTYMSLAQDWVALSVSGGELVFWDWRADQRVHVMVEDASPEATNGWAVHFRYPNAFVFDTAAGQMRTYTLPPFTPIESSSAGQGVRVIGLSAARVVDLPEVWRGDMRLWQLGQHVPAPFRHSAGAFVHAGIADDKLVHCIMPDMRYANTDADSAEWPFCLTHTLPSRFVPKPDSDDPPPKVVHVASMGHALVTVVDAGPKTGLHAFLTDWKDVGAPASRLSSDAISRRTGGLRNLLDATVLTYHTGYGAPPVGLDAISGRVVMVCESEPPANGREFMIADFA